jgi:hypothetical protein
VCTASVIDSGVEAHLPRQTAVPLSSMTQIDVVWSDTSSPT